MSYVIASGWWCCSDDRLINTDRKRLGDDLIRSREFFEVWLESVKSTTSPKAIVVVDSCSPVKPEAMLIAQVEWLSLPFNAGHATSTVGRWSGWSRAFVVAATYAWMADVEYFVYVEQDCLLLGSNIVEHCLDRMTRDVMVGNASGTPQPLQQSFFIIRRKALAGFIRNFTSIGASDREMTPEWKFAISCNDHLSCICRISPYLAIKTYKILRRFGFKFFDTLPFLGGRQRPINFSNPFVYFQHGTKDELYKYFSLVSTSVPTHIKPDC
jgi:hypothetical protein